MYNTYTAHYLVSKAQYTIQPSDWLELSIISPTPAYLGLSEPLVGLAEGNLSSIRAWPRLIFPNIRVIYNYLWRGRTWVSKPSEELKLIMNVRTTPARALGLLPPVTGGKPSERRSLWGRFECPDGPTSSRGWVTCPQVFGKSNAHLVSSSASAQPLSVPSSCWSSW